MAPGRTRGGINDDVMRSPGLIFSFLLLSILFSASNALAQVQTRVRIIQASNAGSAVDPSLRDVHDQLGSLFNFTSYRLLKDEQFDLSQGRPVDVLAHQGGVALVLTLMRKQKDMAEFRVRIKRDATELLDTQIRLSPGRTVIIGGPKHGEGTIILVITARF